MMTWVDLERIYIVKTVPLDSKGILRSLHERLTSDVYPIITVVFGHFPRALGQMSFLLKCASANLRGFSFFWCVCVCVCIQQSQACAGFIPESQLKSILVIP